MPSGHDRARGSTASATGSAAQHRSRPLRPGTSGGRRRRGNPVCDCVEQPGRGPSVDLRWALTSARFEGARPSPAPAGRPSRPLIPLTARRHLCPRPGRGHLVISRRSNLRHRCHRPGWRATGRVCSATPITRPTCISAGTETLRHSQRHAATRGKPSTPADWLLTYRQKTGVTG